METPPVVEVKVAVAAEVDTRPLNAFLVNPHSVLGVSNTATPQHIHSAYVLLLRNNRPQADMPEEQWQKAVDKITAIEAAYRTLVPWADAGLCMGLELGTLELNMCQHTAKHTMHVQGALYLWVCDQHKERFKGATEVEWKDYDAEHYTSLCLIVAYHKEAGGDKDRLLDDMVKSCSALINL
jgi:hypothetical protein